jgi:hypothetical protein
MSAALGAIGCRDLAHAIGPDASRFGISELYLSFSESFVSADEHVLSLIVKVGAFVDIVEVGKQRTAVVPMAFYSLVMRVSDCRRVRFVPSRSRCPGIDGAIEKLRYLLKRQAIMVIVGYKSLLVALVMGNLPSPPPV